MNKNTTYVSIENNLNTLTLDGNQTLNQQQCKLSISFVKTLRIPDDNNKYNLPPGLGNFPLKHVEDYQNVPSSWKEHGGIFLPMYQSEAMWLKFNSSWPFAIKIAAGKINAVSGETWNPNLQIPVSNLGHDMLARSPEDKAKYFNEYKLLNGFLPSKNQKPDYIVSPKQPWLDGFNVGKGLIRQFVAMPLGDGYSVEEQLTGQGKHGGVQIIAYPMKASYYEKMIAQRVNNVFISGELMCSASGASFGGALRSINSEMGLGAGGFMKQDIYDDPYGIDAWDLTKPIRVFVHLLNSLEYQNITGELPLTKPLNPKDYAQYNYPWFDYYSDGKVLEGSDKLAKVDSIASLDMKKGQNKLENNTSIIQPSPHILGIKTVKNGNW